MYAQVTVDIAHSCTDRVFTYSCPDGVVPGCRVRVPFGGRETEGFVTAVTDEPDASIPAEKIKPVSKVYDEPPALTPEALSLAGYISGRYRVPMALSLRLFLPSEMRRGSVREAVKAYVVYDMDVPLGRGAAKQAGALEYMRSAGEAAYTEICSLYGKSAVDALVKKGALMKEERRITRSPMPGLSGDGKAKTLTPAQKAAIESVETCSQRVTLIHGVTGSGKTEIYLNIIASCLEKGKSAIFLVPEISLTPQMLAQFRDRFGDLAAVMHSGLTAGERYDEWRRLRDGEARIAIGARSAVFAPVRDIGAIIIDEEHDSSYFSDTAPRYSTLDIAVRRAEANGCKVVLGSATPSIESYAAAKEGRYNLVTLKERINGREMPEIVVADMRREVKRGNMSLFSAELRGEIEDTLKGGNQAILFLNRRGYSPTVICQECGYVAKCRDCDVSLTYHRAENCLKCHYCGARYAMLTACPECGSTYLKYGGVGTQKVVSELQGLFPDARIVRMDNDTVSGRDGHYKILKQFAGREADILVGTQMIAKGHDFPSVTLVGVVDADMSLHFSDYRCGERTFQLITQVAGRSGRAGEKGRVVVQTSCPENWIIKYCRDYDYEGFFENETAIRKASLYPPYALIVRVMVTGTDEGAAVEALKGVYEETERLRQGNPGKFIFFNRMHSPVKRIKGKYRYQVLMRLTDDCLLGDIYEIAERHSGGKTLVYVEENPMSLS